MTSSSSDSMAAMPTANIYIQDADGYVGRHLIEAIRTRTALWDGGAEIPAASDDSVDDDRTRRLVPVSAPDSADIVVVNLFGDLDQAAALIKVMRALDDLDVRPRVLIALSTALAWAGTAAAAEADETRFRTRQPAAAVARHKLLETLVVNSARDGLRTAVVAAGVLYGAAEADLHGLFRQAWLSAADSAALPVVGDGANLIPTVHVADFAAAAVRYLERPPPRTRPYVLVTDKSRDTQLAIVTAIAMALSTGAVAVVSELDAVRDGVVPPHVATANVAVAARDTSWVAGLDLEWRCENGLVASIDRVVDEFVRGRDLRPIRVAVIGGPGAGRSYWARRIASRFYLPLVPIRDLIAAAKQRVDLDLQLDKSGRAPVAVVAALVRAELQRPELRNKGYVLDGYPRSAEEARAVFEPPPPPPADDDAATDAAPPRPVNIVPDRVLCVAVPDSVALSRAKENSAQAIAGHSDEKGLQRRLHAWAKAVAVADNHPRTFFTASAEILDVNNADPVDDDAVAAYVGGPRPPYNYHPTEDEIAAAAAAQLGRERAAAQDELERQRQLEMEREHEAAEHERKAAERQVALAQLARREAEAVADRARPLQQYLDERVVPIVVQGLVEIARVRPDDPVDYLAEFLFRASTTAAGTAAVL